MARRSSSLSLSLWGLPVCEAQQAPQCPEGNTLIELQMEKQSSRSWSSSPRRGPCPRLRAICLSGIGPCQFCNLLCIAISMLGLFVLVIAIFFIGSAVEMNETRRLPNTDWVYHSPRVCSAQNATFPTRDAAQSAGALVRSCGECGQCSNAHDILVYWATKSNMTKETTACAMRAVLGGRESATSCMLNKFNMTIGCNECWIDNIMCDLGNCVFTCLLYRMGWGGSNNVGGREGASSGRCPG